MGKGSGRVFLVVWAALSAGILIAYTGPEYLKMAVKANEEGLYSLSNRQIDKFLEASPGHPNRDYASLLYAVNLIRLKEFSAAQQRLDTFLRDFPDSKLREEALVYLTLVYLETSDTPRALATYGTIVAGSGRKEDIERQIADRMYSSAASLLKEGKLSESDALFDSILSSFPGTDLRGTILYYRGIIAYRRDDFLKASESLERAVAAGADTQVLPDACLKLGDSYLNTQRLDKAGETYRKLVAQFPDSAAVGPALLQLASVYRRAGSYRETEECLTRILGEKKATDELRAQALFELGKLKMVQEKWGNAEGYFRRLIAEYPKSPLGGEAYLQIGFTNFNRDDFDSATRSFENFLAGTPDPSLRPSGSFGLGYAWYKKGDTAKAAAAWNEVLRQYPASKFVPEIVFLLGKRYYEQKDFAAAERYFGKLAEEFPGNAFAVLSAPFLIESLLRQDKLNDARAAAEKYLAARENQEVFLLYAKTLYKLQLFEEAAKAYTRITAENPSFKAESLFFLGEILLHQGRKTAAREKFLEILTFYPRVEQWSAQARSRLKQIPEK